MSADWELQKAVYSALDAALSVGVYSLGGVPQKLESLYVVIGNTTLIPHDTDGLTGFEVTIVIDSWDSDDTSEGFGKLKPLMGEIYTALNRVNLAVAGYNVLDCFFEFQNSMLDPDGVTTHGVQRFRAILAKQ